MFPVTGERAVGVFSSAVSSVSEEKGLYEGYHITELLSRGDQLSNIIKSEFNYRVKDIFAASLLEQKGKK